MADTRTRGMQGRAFPPLAVARPITWVFVAVAVLKTVADPDLSGHVKFGLDVPRDRSLTTADPYSFTQDVPWVTTSGSANWRSAPRTREQALRV
jgi:hypothetical protein